MHLGSIIEEVREKLKNIYIFFKKLILESCSMSLSLGSKITESSWSSNWQPHLEKGGTWTEEGPHIIKLERETKEKGSLMYLANTMSGLS